MLKLNIMEIVILSEYSDKNNTGVSSINVNTNISQNNFGIGNLVMKEFFKRENDGTFSYIKETMIIVDVSNENELNVTLKPVVRLQLNSKEIIAIVTNYEETLYYIDGSWHNEDNLDGDKTCDNVTVISPQEVVYRTNISKNYMFEENGKTVPIRQVNVSNYQPLWCNV